MREIKFRAWDRYKKRFVYVELLPEGKMSFPAKDYIGHLGHGIDHIHYSNLEDWEQDTGLKDKNGKPIYVGDIVVSGTGDPQSIDVVVYQAPSFVMKRKPHHKTWRTFVLPPDENQFQEIIGDIHQNPELLENNDEHK